MTARKFKYEWRRTWEDKPYDFSVSDGENCFGRVYLHDTGPVQHWAWFMSDESRGEMNSVNGGCDTRDEACRAVEAAYDAGKKSSNGD
jgi:hypothetical protein